MRVTGSAAVVVVTAVAACGCGSRTTPIAKPGTRSVGAAPARNAHRRLPPLRRCRLPAEAANGGLLDAAVGGGATCATAGIVLRRVGHWKGRTCWERCPRHVRMARGFSCSTFKIGEADWSVDCWRGREVVHTSLAD
jgi:hypothetical protein